MSACDKFCKVIAFAVPWFAAAGGGLILRHQRGDLAIGCVLLVGAVLIQQVVVRALYWYQELLENRGGDDV